jgi:glyoxylase-like metal-dependent hydrolase (beta-lactamase superfamily II)
MKRGVMTFNIDSAGTFPRQLADGLWVLGNYFFNLYLVQGEQACAVIEAGVSAVVDDIVSQLTRLNCQPTFLVVTHPHTDHVTGLDGFKEKYPQLLIIAADGASEFLIHPKTSKNMIDEDKCITEALASHGIKAGRPPVQEAPSLENCLVAKDGDIMDLGGKTLHFLSAKGHSPGSIVVHVPEIKALFVSDSLGFRYPGRRVFPLFFTNYQDYLDTLDRCRALNPTIVGPAHQGPLMGDEVPLAFEESRRQAVELRKKIQDDERDPETIVSEIFDTYYRDELTLYTAENIKNCAELIIKRSRE